ncbi:MAG: leucine-rich repeat domain-containing protein [Oscillospiraceae bacterium]|nr:leucine-rich repeat domain-containing protein [Oscillospiraceae bacterium]
MKQKFLCAGSGMLAALTMLAVCTVSVAAEESEGSEEIVTYTSGDYTYSRLVESDNEENKAACIISYTGSETDVVIPDQIDGLDVVQLGDTAFAGSRRIERVTLPSHLQDLGSYTFAECPGILEYKVAEDNVNFESREGVLYTADGYTLLRYPLGTMPEKVTVPEGVKMVGNVAFTCSADIKEIELPDSLEIIGVSAFSDCPQLESVVIPEGVELIDSFAFNSCKKLKSVKLPTTLLQIGDGAFSATALTEISLPSSLQKIGMQAFASTKLTEARIPASVTDIGYSAFGWDVRADGELIMNENFVIYGEKGSVAHEYCFDSDDGNHFIFIEDTSQSDSTAESSTDESAAAESAAEQSDSSTGISGRAIGIAGCAAAMIGILIAAVVSGKKSKKETGKDE